MGWHKPLGLPYQKNFIYLQKILIKFNMKKAILFIRSSTEKQEIESQLKETREYAESLKEFDDYIL